MRFDSKSNERTNDRPIHANRWTMSIKHNREIWNERLLKQSFRRFVCDIANNNLCIWPWAKYCLIHIFFLVLALWLACCFFSYGCAPFGWVYVSGSVRVFVYICSLCVFFIPEFHACWISFLTRFVNIHRGINQWFFFLRTQHNQLCNVKWSARFDSIQLVHWLNNRAEYYQTTVQSFHELLGHASIEAVKKKILAFLHMWIMSDEKQPIVAFFYTFDATKSL